MNELLKKIRIVSNISLDNVIKDLDEKFGIKLSKQGLYKYELGIINLKNETLKALTNYYGIPFDLEKSITFRKYASQNISNLDDIIAEAFNYVSKLNKLENTSKLLTPPSFKSLSNIKVNDFNSLDFFTEKLRIEWGLGNSPIGNLHSLIESKGIKVFLVNSFIEGFHGMNTTLDNASTIILSTKTQLNNVKNHISIVRKRSTLLHELAHIIVPFDESLEEEKVEMLCTSFSGSMLMPKQEMKEIIGENRTVFSLKELLAIKATWGISLQSFLYTALNRNIIEQSLKEKALLMIKKNSIINGKHILYEPDEIPENEIIYNPEFAKLTYKGIEESFRLLWLQERSEMTKDRIRSPKTTRKL